MENRNTKKSIKKDITFLEEIRQNAVKWKEWNDYVAKEMLFTLIDDWIDDLKITMK